jgi:type II secretory pathway component PulF
MLFNYKAVDATGVERDGTIEAINVDIAISSLQRRGLVVSSVKAPDEGFYARMKNVSFFQGVNNKEIVILSRQMAILFDAQVSALRVFRLLANESENPFLAKTLLAVSDDLQGGSLISKALEKHPKAFSSFYVNMVKAGEESGKLNQTFLYLADYLDRNFEVTSKAKNALIYPAFVVCTFIAVMLLMFTMVIPKISVILIQGGGTIPVYTQVVIAISAFLVKYGIILVIVVIIIFFFFVRYIRTPRGKESFDQFKLSLPYIGTLYRKLYLSRIADNMNTMLLSGITMIKALEVTSNIVGNDVYKGIIEHALEAVKGGSPLSDSLHQFKEIPGIFVQMVKVGEETGELGNILKTLSRFYQREVVNAVDTLVDLIEPAMIVFLGVGVGILLASVLVPIYNLSSSFS